MSMVLSKISQGNTFTIYVKICKVEEMNLVFRLVVVYYFRYRKAMLKERGFYLKDILKISVNRVYRRRTDAKQVRVEHRKITVGHIPLRREGFSGILTV